MQHRSGPTASNRGVLHVHVHRFCSAQAINEQHDSNQIHSDCVKLNQTKAINITKLCPEESRVFMCTSIQSNIIRCAGGRVEHHLRWGGTHHLRCAAATSVRGGGVASSGSTCSSNMVPPWWSEVCSLTIQKLLPVFEL